MHVFVAGATGVLGRALVPRLLQQGHTVRALVRSPERGHLIRATGVELVSGDLLTETTAQQLPSLVRGCDAVVHIATAIPRNPTDASAWEPTTRLRTEGTRLLLEAAQAAGARYYIQQSIAIAYPDGGERWLDETTPLDRSPQRSTICGPVIMMEEMVQAVNPAELGWCILRGGSFVGRGTAQDTLVARLREGRLVVICDGSNFISPIHVADMATAIIAALQPAAVGRIFNIVATPVRYGEYVDHIAALLQVPPPPRDPSMPCPPSFRCSNEAARRLLGWQPTHDIYEDVVPTQP
ncbi:NAD-dependent epimerase/dehydratase family protein [Thermogemmatispora sp.]|uniref:NAD-dependent epimerase/dehydratase family protein n=1 Tax=Thermogemmatispora sp. TaxID=1968838 RepID=UPI001D3D8EF5|nr:NAD(P)-dependent oxidoreductase [Thermogemmatispora sp.]MBX5451702.1 NAD(P)-dependent oxidoreductase [Thermogemmatispora sp.]